MSSEVYRPTPEEVARLRPREGLLKISGDGIFVTRQGEGITAGEKAAFIRLHWCNLACGREGGWQCDTGYTWDKRTPEFWQEPRDVSPEGAAEEIRRVWARQFGTDSKHRVVVTGGEPMLQQKELVALFAHLTGWNVEIETNGTIAPLPELSGHQFNCSPKLSNSGNSYGRRYRPDVLRKIAQLPNSWFKFVVVGVRDLIEIEEMVKNCEIPAERVLVMPEGQTAEAVSLHANILDQPILEKGWRITLRNQLIWYGLQRRT